MVDYGVVCISGAGHAQSPDLKQIEDLWDELEQRLRAWPSHPTSMYDLTNVRLEEWSKIPRNTLPNLVESFPRRAEELQRVGQHHSKC